MASQKNTALVIGDINRDIAVKTDEEIQRGSLQFGEINSSLGGVGRNVALNLQKLGTPTTFLTAIADDPYGKEALKEAKELGINMAHAKYLENEETPTILFLSDADDELVAGIESLRLLDFISPDYLKSKAALINAADWCMVSGNLPIESLNYLTNYHPQAKFIFDPASSKMAKKVKDMIGQFHTVTPNQEEAEILSEISIHTKDDAVKAAKKINESGAKQVILTLKNGGAVYQDGEDWKIAETPAMDPVNSTGAGDAFSAALMYCFYKGQDLNNSIRFAIAASSLTLKAEEAVHPDMSVQQVKEMMEELKKEHQ